MQEKLIWTTAPSGDVKFGDAWRKAGRGSENATKPNFAYDDNISKMHIIC